MVQVDFFWSYGIGAGFAVANTWQLERQQAAQKSSFEHTSFRDTLLYLSCLFVPSGAYLIWQFPSWETMHVGSRGDIPGWLVAAFTMTNATQGLLGFAVAAALLRQRRQYAAYLQWILGYFLMLFILVHGWDGTGYMRFFSSTREELVGWTWQTAARWITGDVGQSLIAMGIVVLPVMFWLMARDLKRGYPLGAAARSERAGRRSTTGLGLTLLGALIVGVLGTAILASLAIRYLGAVIGILTFAVVAYFAGFRRGGVFHRHFRHVVYGDPLVARSAAPMAYQRQSG
jgi:hypothetical protein